MLEIRVLKEASEVGLAIMLSDLIQQNLKQKPDKINDFDALNAHILIEARDIQITVGLTFKKGKLTVSKGLLVKPDLHIIADSITILNLSLVRIRFGLPYLFDANGFRVLKKILTRELLIKRMIRNFGVLVKLTKVVSIV